MQCQTSSANTLMATHSLQDLDLNPAMPSQSPKKKQQQRPYPHPEKKA